MPQLIFLPHAERCPEGAVIEAEVGDVLIDVGLSLISIFDNFVRRYMEVFGGLIFNSIKKVIPKFKKVFFLSYNKTCIFNDSHP